MNIFSS